jgi:hypothetical protein
VLEFGTQRKNRAQGIEADLTWYINLQISVSFSVQELFNSTRFAVQMILFHITLKSTLYNIIIRFIIEILLGVIGGLQEPRSEEKLQVKVILKMSIKIKNK